MATIVAAAGGGNWTTGGTWVGGVAPTAADDASLTSSSGNVTIDSGAVCRSLDCDGYTGTLTHTAAVALTIGDGTAGAGNRALRFSSGMTYTLGNATTSSISFISTAVTQQTVDYAGKTVGDQTFNGVGGTWALASAITTGTGATVTVTNGSFTSSAYAINVGKFSSNNSNTRSVNLNGSAITLTGSGTIWVFATTTNLSFSNTGSSITITNTSGSLATFASGAGAATYPTINVQTSSVAPLRFTGAAKTFTNSTFVGPCIVETTAGMTITFTNAPTITSSRSQPVSFLSITPGSQYTFSCPSGTFGSRYMSIFDCIGSGGATFVARESYGNNTTGWTIVPPRINQAMATLSYALNFPNNAAVDVVSASNSGVSANGSWSLCAWINVTGYTGTRQDVHGVNFTPTNSAISIGSTGLYTLNDPIGLVATTVRAPIGRMVPVVTTWDATNARGSMYFDGYLIYTRTGTATAFTDGKIVTGRFAFSAAQPAWATASRRRIFSRALSAAEVMAWSRDNVEPDSTGLQAQYNLLAGSGSTDVDTSGNNNNGTITGAAWVTDRVYTARVAAANRVAIPAAVAGVAATGNITVTDYQYLAGKDATATITVTDYTAMGGGVLEILGGPPDGIAVEEGLDFTAEISNNQTATNLAAGINTVVGETVAVAVGATVTLTIPGGNNGAPLTWDASGLTPTSTTFAGGFDATVLNYGSSSNTFVVGGGPGDISPGTSNDECATNIATAIDGTTGVSAAAVGNVVTITYTTVGTVGNSYAISQSAYDGGTISNGLTFSGATLSGGVDAVVSRTAATNRVQL